MIVIQDYFDKEDLGLVEKFPINIETKAFKKNHKIVAEGDFVNDLYFINDGILEVGIGEGDGRKILDFYSEGMISTGGTSILMYEPSKVYVKCLTDCVVQMIPYDKVVKKSNTSILVNKFLVSLLKNEYIRKVEKEEYFLSNTVESLYNELLKDKYNFVEKLPISNLARYLNIHPNSLSRIRKRLASRRQLTKN